MKGRCCLVRGFLLSAALGFLGPDAGDIELENR